MLHCQPPSGHMLNSSKKFCLLTGITGQMLVQTKLGHHNKAGVPQPSGVWSQRQYKHKYRITLNNGDRPPHCHRHLMAPGHGHHHLHTCKRKGNGATSYIWGFCRGNKPYSLPQPYNYSKEVNKFLTVHRNDITWLQQNPHFNKISDGAKPKVYS